MHGWCFILLWFCRFWLLNIIIKILQLFVTCQKMSFCLVLFFPFGIKIYCINAYVFRFVVNLLYMTPGITEFIKSILSWWNINFFIYSFHYLKYFNNMLIFILKSWRDKTKLGLGEEVACTIFHYTINYRREYISKKIRWSNTPWRFCDMVLLFILV